MAAVRGDSRRVHSGGPDRTAPQRPQPVSAAASSSRAGARHTRTLENGESVQKAAMHIRQARRSAGT